jgi:hypothetical protein
MMIILKIISGFPRDRSLRDLLASVEVLRPAGDAQPQSPGRHRLHHRASSQGQGHVLLRGKTNLLSILSYCSHFHS